MQHVEEGKNYEATLLKNSNASVLFREVKEPTIFADNDVILIVDIMRKIKSFKDQTNFMTDLQSFIKNYEKK